MSTISVPLNSPLEEKLNNLVRSGYAENRAAAMRKALLKAAEDEAVQAVLRAEKETPLYGDLRELAKKLK